VNFHALRRYEWAAARTNFLVARGVEKLGGKVCLPPKDIPMVGRIAIFTDPQGATLGLFQPVAR
jgi:predicted enzyme related to lactoylglutathione lyase